jgi:hypothetical protein
MFMTADTPTGSPVTVIRTNTSIGFNQVTIGGCTWVTTSSTNPLGPIPPGFAVVGPFRDVLTTASYAGAITVGLPFDPSGVPDEQQLRLFHWNGFRWEDVTTSIDTTNDIVYGQVPSLSWFFIGGQWVWVPDEPTLPVHELVLKPLGLLDSLLRHFVTGRASTPVVYADQEWTLSIGSFSLTNKGNYLVGAVADIITYGSTLVNWIIQALR